MRQGPREETRRLYLRALVKTIMKIALLKKARKTKLAVAIGSIFTLLRSAIAIHNSASF